MQAQIETLAYYLEERYLFLEIELKLKDCVIGRNLHPKLLEGFPSCA